jgi:holo-[acyl-carrier protein] synthase
MRLAIGIDVVDVSRIEEVLSRRGARFVRRVFTAGEAAYCQSKARPAIHFAGRFAAKEAVLKALGTGFGLGAELCEVEIVDGAGGPPAVRLHGRALARAAAIGLASIAVSISHTPSVAVAQAVGVCEGGTGSSPGPEATQ